MGLYLLTFTLRYDPNGDADLSIEGLQRRGELTRTSARFVWNRYLKTRGRAAAMALEVSARGAVHVHMLYHGRRPDIRSVRELWMFNVGDSPIVNVKYVARPGKAICEVAKYVAKSASPRRVGVLGGLRSEFTDPRLAARIELAFIKARLLQCYGAWRGVEEDDDLAEVEPAACVSCGSVGHWHLNRLTYGEWLRLAPGGWIPRFGRDPPQFKAHRSHVPAIEARKKEDHEHETSAVGI